MSTGTSKYHEDIQKLIKENLVVVFSKTYCPYCANTKKLFAQLNVSPKIIELDGIEDGSNIQRALLDLTGQRTVPNVFVRGNHIGGNDDTVRAKSTGELEKLLFS